MIPKEKAKELLNMFIPLTKKFDSKNGLLDDEDDAIKCSLVTVDEILKITWIDKFLTVQEYWQEVKQEIKNYESNR